MYAVEPVAFIAPSMAFRIVSSPPFLLAPQLLWSSSTWAFASTRRYSALEFDSKRPTASQFGTLPVWGLKSASKLSQQNPPHVGSGRTRNCCNCLMGLKKIGRGEWI